MKIVFVFLNTDPTSTSAVDLAVVVGASVGGVCVLLVLLVCLMALYCCCLRRYVCVCVCLHSTVVQFQFDMCFVRYIAKRRLK